MPLNRPEWPWAVVEIAAESGRADALLIRAAYRLSTSGVVALALRGVDAAAVDRLLDEVVAAREDDAKGVVYLDASDEPALLAAAAQAAIVLAATERFAAQLDRHGISAVRAGEALKGGTPLQRDAAAV